MEIICKDRVFTLKNGSDVLLHTDANTPMIYVGYGEERVEMYRGNFKLEDHLLERRPLTPDFCPCDRAGDRAGS